MGRKVDGRNMKTLAEYNGLTLIQKYGQYYIRFIGGQYEEISCDLHITNQEASTILAQRDALKIIRDMYMKQIRWTKDYFVTSALKDYLFYMCNLDEMTIENILNKLDAHQEIKMTLYQTIMYEDKIQDNKVFCVFMEQHFPHIWEQFKKTI